MNGLGDGDGRGRNIVGASDGGVKGVKGEVSGGVKVVDVVAENPSGGGVYTATLLSIMVVVIGGNPVTLFTSLHEE